MLMAGFVRSDTPTAASDAQHQPSLGTFLFLGYMGDSCKEPRTSWRSPHHTITRSSDDGFPRFGPSSCQQRGFRQAPYQRVSPNPEV